MAKVKKASRGVSAKKEAKKALKKPVKKAAASKKKAVKQMRKPVKKTIKKTAKPVKKSKAKPVKKPAAKKVVKKSAAPKAKKAVTNKKHNFNGIGKPKAASKAPQSIPATKQKTALQQSAAKTKPTAEEKLHSKAQRIMKELEETMDITKVKPRIKVPVYTPPKPKPVAVVKLPEPTNTDKEKYQLEFEFRSSKAILFSYLSDSSGLAGWFADEVRSSDDNYVFVWEGSEVHAKQVAVKDQHLVRYQWTDENDGTYFQFEIKEDDITSDIALLITDWALEDEKDTNRMLWENQVQKLRQLLGSL